MMSEAAIALGNIGSEDGEKVLRVDAEPKHVLFIVEDPTLMAESLLQSSMSSIHD